MALDVGSIYSASKGMALKTYGDLKMNQVNFLFFIWGDPCCVRGVQWLPISLMFFLKF